MSEIPAGYRFAPATFSQWKRLAHLHYRPAHVGAFAGAFGLWPLLSPLESALPVAVCVFAFSPFSLAGRNVALGNAFNQARCKVKPFGTYLNANFRTLRRTVVATAHRGRGLAAALHREALPHVGTPYVEAMAATASKHPFQVAAGMKAYPVPVSRPAARLIRLLDTAAVPADVQHDPQALPQYLEELPDVVGVPILRAVLRWHRWRVNSHHPEEHKIDPRDAVERAALGLQDRFSYFLWQNFPPKNRVAKAP